MIDNFIASLKLLPASERANEKVIPELELWLNCRSEQEARERLSVYQNNIVSSLSEALSDTFPVCNQLVGDEYFRALSIEFITGHLPTSPILSHYGAKFSDFLASFPPLADLPYLSEVAFLEYELLLQTLAAEEEVLSNDDIRQRLPEIDDLEQSHWLVTDNLTLWHSRYAAGSLYLAHQPDSDLTPADVNWQQEEYLLLTKLGLWGKCYLLDNNTFQVLQQLKQGSSLGEACQDFDHNQLTQILGQLISLPAFTTITQR